jgi:hypothetical protein
MSILVFSQTFGGAIFLAIAQLIFSHGLTSGLQEYASTLDPQVVIMAGATAVRHVVTPAELPGVLRAYMVGIDRVFYLGTGVAGGVFVFSMGMGWRSVKKGKNNDTVAKIPVEVPADEPAAAQESSLKASGDVV